MEISRTTSIFQNIATLYHAKGGLFFVLLLLLELTEGNFADFGSGKFVAEFVSGWECVNRDVALEKLSDFALDALPRLVPRLQNNEGLRDLAFIMVVDTDNSGSKDCFVRIDDRFEMGWVNIVTT